MQNKVEIIPWYKTNTPDGSFQGMVQCPAYNDCLHRYGIEFDWIAFFDIDEFLTMEYENINQWFDVCQYKNTDSVIVFWYIIGSDGKLFYEPKPVQERFINHIDVHYWTKDKQHITLDHFFKSIVNTKTKYEFIENPHKLSEGYWCDNSLKICTTTNYFPTGQINCMLPIKTHEHAYLKHYVTKSLVEYLDRKLKNPVWNNTLEDMQYNVSVYFNQYLTDTKYETVFNEYVKIHQIN